MEPALLAYCGLYCGACSFKLAHDTHDLEHVRRMPARYDAHKQALPGFCPGCRLENQCGPCAIRDCARDRALLHCGECRDFPCERLVQFSQDGVPHHAASIANLQAVNAQGAEAWLERQQARWTGPQGARWSWYWQEGARRIEPVQGGHELEQAARLASAEHVRLRAALPFLPARDASHFLPKLAWMVREGDLFGLWEGAELRAFLGGFLLEDFRNAGPGIFCPDWCHGTEPGSAAGDAYRALYRALAPRWKAKGGHIHAIGVYATATAALEAFAMTGFGRIMMDAARPVKELLGELGEESGCAVRRATAADAPVLAELNACLAAHIEAAPVFLPNARGMDEAGWRAWFGAPEAVAFLALNGEVVTGYLKAEAPQLDVSDAVHGPGTLAINGAFVRVSERGRGEGKALLRALARHARATGKELLSVDCETLNPEALTFWSRGFRPVAWGLERRT